MATEITRASAAAKTEEVAATTAAEEDSGGAVLIVVDPGALVPVSILTPGIGLEPQPETAPTPAAATEETSPGVA